jgi:hypothetical protein
MARVTDSQFEIWIFYTEDYGKPQSAYLSCALCVVLACSNSLWACLLHRPSISSSLEIGVRHQPKKDVDPRFGYFG